MLLSDLKILTGPRRLRRLYLRDLELLLRATRDVYGDDLAALVAEKGTPDRPAFLGRVARNPAGRWAFLAVFLGAFFVLDARTADALPGQTYLIILYSIGILHFWYDSFIWKLRKPAVAATFGIARA